MAKGSAKKPKESKCRGSSAPIEGRDWVRIGGATWLREVAEKQGKFIPLEYREKSGTEFVRERAERAEEADKAPLRDTAPVVEDSVPDADPPMEDANYEDAVAVEA